MVQVINDPNRRTFGESFSTGINAALQGLAAHKINQMAAQKNIRGLKALDIPNAEELAGLDPKILQQVVKSKLAEPGERAFAQAIIGGGEGSPNQRLTGEQALKIAQLRETQQNNIRAENAPFLKSLEAETEPARSLKESIKEAYRLFNLKDEQGNRIAQLGALRGNIPAALQNPTTQALRAKFNEIVTKKAQLGKGVPSRMRLLLEQASKPDVWMQPKAIDFLLNSLLKSTTESEYKERAKDQILAESNGLQPRGLENQVKKRAKLLEKLPDPSDYSDDTTFEFGGIVWAKNGDEWIPVSKE